MTLRNRLKWVVLYGDTAVPRCILSAIAAMWSALLFLPGDTFTRPVYANMELIAGETCWATAWGIYSICLAWRTFSDTPSRLWVTYIIHVCGVLLFGTSASCIIFSRIWPAPAAMAADIVLFLVAVWLLMRSGLNNVPGWRDD